MFPYYGGKRRLARRYPPPLFDRIIEPFAGAAGYSCLYPERDVTLIERDPEIAAVWRYLIGVDLDRLYDLPLLSTGDRVSEVSGLDDDERRLLRLLAGAWTAGAFSDLVCERPGRRMARNLRHIRDLVPRCRHWTVIEGNYDEAPIRRDATYFIDPPYQGLGGAGYANGNDALDFDGLAAWCRSLPGQTIVTENDEATWLPFRPLFPHKGGTNETKTECVWLAGPQPKAWRHLRERRAEV